MKNKMNFYFSLAVLTVNFSSCTHLIVIERDEYTHTENQKTDINEYIYLETSTGIYNSTKVLQDQLSKQETAAAVKRLNVVQGIEYNESTEEKLEKQASAYMAQGKWKAAFDTLIKYEPVLTHNKNLTNQMIYTSLKMEYYDYAIDQLQLALNQYDEMRALNETRLDKEVILAHVYYLSQKYDHATKVYAKLFLEGNYPESAKYLFLIGYKLKNLEIMKTYLGALGDAHANATEFNVLTAKVEVAQGQVLAARERLQLQFAKHPDNQEVIFEYVNTLIQAQDYEQAQAVLDQSAAQIAETRQYHFMKAFISHQAGDKKEFRRHLASTQVEDRYDHMLTNLFLQKQDYAGVYATIFKQGEIDEYKFTHLVKQATEQFAHTHINNPHFKDAILEREEYRSVTEPIRLPASLEFKPSK
jgi:tetratricopeptide (TPR) repeat protein